MKTIAMGTLISMVLATAAMAQPDKGRAQGRKAGYNGQAGNDLRNDRIHGQRLDTQPRIRSEDDAELWQDRKDELSATGRPRGGDLSKASGTRNGIVVTQPCNLKSGKGRLGQAVAKNKFVGDCAQIGTGAVTEPKISIVGDVHRIKDGAVTDAKLCPRSAGTNAKLRVVSPRDLVVIAGRPRR
jgi:hypothetical protein